MVTKIMDYKSIYEYDFGVKKIRYTGNEGLGCCPLPSHNDTKPSFSFNISSGVCFCHSCRYSGNAYTLAKELNIPNPHQYRDSSTYHSNNSYEPHIEAITPLKSESMVIYNACDMAEIAELKERFMMNFHGENAEPIRKQKNIGYDDDGKLVWLYPLAIKYHKSAPHWHPKSLDKECQILGEDWIDISNPVLYICEGESDWYALYNDINAVTFSAGCSSIPKRLSPLFYDDLKKIVILYDNDDAGKKGMMRLAKHLKDIIMKKSKDIVIETIKWDDDLPKGFDISNAIDKGKPFFEDTISKTEVYELPVDEYIEPSNTISKPKKVKGFQSMPFGEFIDTYKDEDTAPIIKNLVGEGNITLISGDVDVGKSWVATHMGLSIATGTPFFNIPIEKKKKVLMFQFELSNGEWAERMVKLEKIYGRDMDFEIILIDKEAEIFVDAWHDIEKTIIDKGLRDSVVIIDNLYTSTDKDVTVNSELQVVVGHIRRIVNRTGNTFIIVGHHNKNKDEKLKILNMDLIQGGRTLTANVNYILQLGISHYSPDVKRGKITKTRGAYYEMKDIPFMIHFDPDTGMFRKGVIITDENKHCIQFEKRWEIEIAKDFANYQEDKEFDKARLWQHLSTEEGWEETNSNSTKVSRLLKTLVEFGIFIKKRHNCYVIDLEALATVTKKDK